MKLALSAVEVVEQSREPFAYDGCQVLLENLRADIPVLENHGQITQKSLQDAQHPQRLFLCLVEGVGMLFSRLFCKRNGL